MKKDEFIQLLNRRTFYSLMQAHLLTIDRERKEAGFSDSYAEPKLEELLKWCDKRLGQYEKDINKQVDLWD